MDVYSGTHEGHPNIYVRLDIINKMLTSYNMRSKGLPYFLHECSMHGEKLASLSPQVRPDHHKLGVIMELGHAG